MIPVDWTVAGPALIVACGAILALLLDAFWRRRSWLFPAFATAAGLTAAGAELVCSGGFDPYSYALSLVILAGTLFVVVAAGVMNHEGSMPPGEFHFLIGISAAGGLCMVGARDLVTLIVSIELLALPSIALVGLRRGDREAIRSAWTFFLFSVTSTAVTLMGVSLIYGISGSMTYAGIDAGLRGSTLPPQVITVAVVLTLVGLLFKLGAVPFHLWIPDAYRGASIPVAAYLSVVSKAASLGALVILVAIALPSAAASWQLLIAIAAVLTMTVGNLGALRQRDAIGMLAWSSIAQAGFLIAPIVAVFTVEGLSAPLQYLAVYAVANLIAFTVVALVRRSQGDTSYAALRGLARTDVLAGGALAFALLALAGFPPAVIGLVTKFLVLRPVLDAGYGFLAVVMAVNVAIGLAYYLRLIVVLFERPADAPSAIGLPGRSSGASPSPPYSVRLARLSVALATGSLIALSVWPAWLLSHFP